MRLHRVFSKRSLGRASRLLTLGVFRRALLAFDVLATGSAAWAVGMARGPSGLSVPAVALVRIISSVDDWFGSYRWIRLIARDDLLGDGTLEQSFDLLQLFSFINTDQGYGRSFAFGTAGASDAVHVVFGHTGQLKVHHVRQLIDIEPS